MRGTEIYFQYADPGLFRDDSGLTLNEHYRAKIDAAMGGGEVKESEAADNVVKMPGK